jgi:protein-S-isoprenylcysteine O-methyltransferase Ste14
MLSASVSGFSFMIIRQRRTFVVAFKTLVFSILVPGTVTVIIPWLLLRGEGSLILPISSVWMVGLLPLLLGVGLYVWCAGAFTFIGRGTPAPIDAPRVFVTQGAYRWVRNPMYVAVLLVVIGEAILFRSLLLAGYALLLWATFHTFVVFVEEPQLVRRFGASYETYVHTVPRWLPRIPQE